jgi:hypothetical protein
VSALFDEFEKADEESSLDRAACLPIADSACADRGRAALSGREGSFEGEEEDEDLVNEAEVEHGSAKELIAKIEGMSSGDDHFTATVTVLGEYIKHHVKEEEKRAVPAAEEDRAGPERARRPARGAQVRTDGAAGHRGTGSTAQPRKRSAGRAASRPKSSSRRSGSRARH